MKKPFGEHQRVVNGFAMEIHRVTFAATLCSILVMSASGFPAEEVDESRGPGVASSRSAEKSVVGEECIGGPGTSGLTFVPPEAAAGISTQALLDVFLPCGGRFFGENSPWNRPISSYSTANFTQIDALEGFDSPGFSPWAESGWVAIYKATEDDPVRGLYFHKDAWINVANGQWKRWGNGTWIEYVIRVGMDQHWSGYEANMYSSTKPSGYGVPDGFKPRTDHFWSVNAYVPDSALPSPDVDGNLAIVQPNGWVLEVLGGIRLSTGELVGVFHSYSDPEGIGDGLANGRRASMIPNYAGILSNEDLEAGRIDHALCLTLGPEALAQSFVWPATAMDRDPHDYRGSLPMGTLLAIPPQENLENAGLATETGKMVARAAQEYGMYVVDRAGSHGFVICTERDMPSLPSWTTDLETDLLIVRDLLQLVEVHD